MGKWIRKDNFHKYECGLCAGGFFKVLEKLVNGNSP